MLLGYSYRFVLGYIIGIIEDTKINKEDNIIKKALLGLLKVISKVYVEVFRDTHMIVQAMVIYFGIKLAGFAIEPIPVAILVTLLNTGAYMSETVCAGIKSIDVGQREGALALGMSPISAMFNIILPQAFKNVVLEMANTLQAIKAISENLTDLYNGSTEPEKWDAVTWASTIGGMVIHTAGVALPHGMEHPASGLKNIVHGRGLAALTPVITDASFSGAPEKYEVISGLLGGKDASDCGDAVRKLLQSIDLSVTLSEQGIVKDDIPWLTENCFKVSEASIRNHPVLFDRDGIAKLYEQAL